MSDEDEVFEVVTFPDLDEAIAEIRRQRTVGKALDLQAALRKQRDEADDALMEKRLEIQELGALFLVRFAHRDAGLLFEEILDFLPDDTPKPAFLFPEAPIDLEDEGMYGARAWWRTTRTPWS